MLFCPTATGGVRWQPTAYNPTTHTAYAGSQEGCALGGVSAFFYWRDYESHSTQQARLSPAVFPHGGGLTLTLQQHG